MKNNQRQNGGLRIPGPVPLEGGKIRFRNPRVDVEAFSSSCDKYEGQKDEMVFRVLLRGCTEKGGGTERGTREGSLQRNLPTPAHPQTPTHSMVVDSSHTLSVSVCHEGESTNSCEFSSSVFDTFRVARLSHLATIVR